MRSFRLGTVFPLVVVPSHRHQLVSGVLPPSGMGKRLPVPPKVPEKAMMPPMGMTPAIAPGAVAILTFLLPSKVTFPVTAPVRLIFRAVARAATLPSVRPVPPRAAGNVPETPGVMLAVPSKLAAVVDARFTRTERAVASLVEEPALPVHEPEDPVTEVCSGWTWSSLAYLAEVPTAAVPGALGAALAAPYVVLVSVLMSPTSSHAAPSYTNSYTRLAAR